jgi:copper chaperone CopZ
VEIRVKIDWEGCKRTVKKVLEGMKGVKDVSVDLKEHEVMVVGYVDPGKVVSRMEYWTSKKAEIRPYIKFKNLA